MVYPDLLKTTIVIKWNLFGLMLLGLGLGLILGLILGLGLGLILGLGLGLWLILGIGSLTLIFLP